MMNQTQSKMGSPPQLKKKLPNIAAQGSHNSTRVTGVVNKKNSQNDTASLTMSNAASNNINGGSNLT